MVKIGDLGHRTEHRLLIAALDDKRANRITQAELTAICIVWSYYYCLDDLRPLPMPITPDYVRTYWGMTFKEKRKLWRGELTEARSKLMDFFREESKVKTSNHVKHDELKKMLRYFEEKKELDKAYKVREVLNEY